MIVITNYYILLVSIIINNKIYTLDIHTVI